MFLCDSSATVMLVSKVLDGVCCGLRVVQKVDDHVKSVQNTRRVCRELGTLRVLDVDARERFLDFGLCLSQPSQHHVAYTIAACL